MNVNELNMIMVCAARTTEAARFIDKWYSTPLTNIKVTFPCLTGECHEIQHDFQISQGVKHSTHSCLHQGSREKER